MPESVGIRGPVDYEELGLDRRTNGGFRRRLVEVDEPVHQLRIGVPPDGCQRGEYVSAGAVEGSDVGFDEVGGILIEHHGGRFPAWLAPVQVGVLPVADRHTGEARRIADGLMESGVRVRVDDRTESVGRKIRDAELAKLPFMVILGDREAESGKLSVRSHVDGDLGEMDVQDLRSILTPR